MTLRLSGSNRMTRTLRRWLTTSVVVLLAVACGMGFFAASKAQRAKVVATDRSADGAAGRDGAAAPFPLRAFGMPPPGSDLVVPAAVSEIRALVGRDARLPPREGVARHLPPLASPWLPTARMIERMRAVIGPLGPLRPLDYSDPSDRGSVPLMLVSGAERTQLSKHFRVGDFVASDGAAFARISLDLVHALEALQERVGRPVYVNSAYRHPALNFRLDVGGAGESFHMAGLVADIRVEDATPIEVAEAALDTLGCGIGLGLGAYFLHVDLRGWGASWAREGAAMDEVDFDLWVLDRCGGMQVAAVDSTVATQATALSVAEIYRDEMIAFARVLRRRGRVGAIVLDMRLNVPGRDTSAVYSLDFAEPGSPLLRSLSLDTLLQRTAENDAFVYIIVGEDGALDVGAMDYQRTLVHGRLP